MAASGQHWRRRCSSRSANATVAASVASAAVTTGAWRERERAASRMARRIETGSRRPSHSKRSTSQGVVAPKPNTPTIAPPTSRSATIPGLSEPRTLIAAPIDVMVIARMTRTAPKRSNRWAGDGAGRRPERAVSTGWRAALQAGTRPASSTAPTPISPAARKPPGSSTRGPLRLLVSSSSHGLRPAIATTPTTTPRTDQ